MTRKEAATIMTETFPLAKEWWKSPKHEKAYKQFVEAKKVYKEHLTVEKNLTKLAKSVGL